MAIVAPFPKHWSHRSPSFVADTTNSLNAPKSNELGRGSRLRISRSASFNAHCSLACWCRMPTSSFSTSPSLRSMSARAGISCSFYSAGLVKAAPWSPSFTTSSRCAFISREPCCWRAGPSTGETLEPCSPPRIWRGRAQCSRVKPGRRAAGRHGRPAVDHKHWSLHELWLHAPSLGCLRRTRGRPGADWHPIASAPPLMMKLSVNSEDESSGSCVLSKQENTIISKPKSPTECSSLQID